ncbi:hypothetical protein [Rhodobacter ferrooxidans]|nr:hypothetical protein [Rhodobacter sp. SW2]
MRTLLLSLCLASPATAQTVFERAAGTYGSASDPALSCASNPHTLSFEQSPPHAIFRWNVPRPDPDGRISHEDIFDLRGSTDTTLSMQREGEARLPETGRRPTWILRLTANPAGYCWGRQDWPLVRCVNPAVRCDSETPTS